MDFRIAFYPKAKGVNDYTKNFSNILSSIGKVYEYDTKFEIFSFLNFNRNRYNLTIVNWLESDLIDMEGKVTVKNICKTFIKLLLINIRSEKVFYVKHNFYPHEINVTNIEKAKKWMHILVKYCDYGIVHSPIAADAYYKYVPHPLYSKPLVSVASPHMQTNTFIAFGRIVPYKRLERLIEIFPLGKKLLVAGGYEDTRYIDELKEISPSNVTVMAGFINDDDARKLIASTEGVIISHSDPDMIVSGSFFYALSMGARVISVQTPFLKWAESVLGKNVVVCFESVTDMCEGLSKIPNFIPYDEETVNNIMNLFGDDVIKEKLISFIDKK
ncbi:hypothetical protein ACL2XQ_17020 [Sodalis sp. RH14]|uniref:hypothetical protein n=1 Tax=Sodalis sp. RH14 TaxID=3394329 RepID=UPI0039B38954